MLSTILRIEMSKVTLLDIKNLLKVTLSVIELYEQQHHSIPVEDLINLGPEESTERDPEESTETVHDCGDLRELYSNQEPDLPGQKEPTSVYGDWNNIEIREKIIRDTFGRIIDEFGYQSDKITFDDNAKCGIGIVYISKKTLMDPDLTTFKVREIIVQQLDAFHSHSGDTGGYEVYCNRNCFHYIGDPPKSGTRCKACGDLMLFRVNN